MAMTLPGRLKVKVGPVSLTYKGTATFKERDSADRSVLVEASGKEMRGAGTASAAVRAALRPEDSSDSGTLVTLHTTLNVTGRPAQFGRGVIAEVGSRLIDRFADNLAQQLTNGGVAAAAGPAAAPPPASAPGAASSPAGAASGTAGAASAFPGRGLPFRRGDDGRQRCGRRALRRGSAGFSSLARRFRTAGFRTAGFRTAGFRADSDAPAAHVPLQTAPEPVQSVPVQRQDDSLDLLSLVGPVIVKRLAPVVGAATAVALLTWGIRRVIRRRKSA